MIKDNFESTLDDVGLRSFEIWEDLHKGIWLTLLRLFEGEGFRVRFTCATHLDVELIQRKTLAETSGWKTLVQEAAVSDEWVWVGRLGIVVQGGLFYPFLPRPRPRSTISNLFSGFRTSPKKETKENPIIPASPGLLRAVKQITDNGSSTMFSARDWVRW